MDESNGIDPVLLRKAIALSRAFSSGRSVEQIDRIALSVRPDETAQFSLAMALMVAGLLERTGFPAKDWFDAFDGYADELERKQKAAPAAFARGAD